MSQEQKETEVQEGAGLYDFDQLIGLEEPEVEEEAEPTFIEEGEEVGVEGLEQEEDIDEAPEVIEKKEVEEEVKVAEKTSNFSSLAKKYIELGLWEDRAIQSGDEELAISELADLDEDTFLQITQAQENLKKDEYIDKKDLDETSLQIIEISKNGGDISEVLRIKKELIDPLEGYNLEDETHQEALVRHMYAMENKALTQKQINSLIEEDKKELSLDTKAEQFADKLKNSYSEVLKKKNQEVLDNREKEKQDLKDLKKNLKKELSNYGNSNYTSPLLDMAVTKGQLEEDFNKLKENPELLAGYLVWRNNPEDYIKKAVSKETTKRDIKKLELLNLAPKHQGQKEVRKDKPKNTNLEEEFFSKIKV